MMYTLVVDDELVSRIKMNMIMQQFGKTKMALSGTEAIEMFEAAYKTGCPFDMVTLDIEMPDLSGTDVLRRMRDIEEKRGIKKGKGAIVMMVTAQQDRINVYTSIMSGCDDYIAKPFNIEIMKNKLDRFGFSHHFKKHERKPDSQDSIFRSIKDALRSGELNLPVLPQIIFKFWSLIENHTRMEEIASLLKQDVMITAKLIQVANSAIYRGVDRVDTIEQAISRLGLSATEQVVTAITNRNLFLSDQKKYRNLLNTLWGHSLATAYSADLICKRMKHPPSVDIFSAGLLHDIGALALVQIIAEMDKRGRFEKVITEESIRETVMLHHIEFGCRILKNWKFSDRYIDIVRYHEAFTDDDAPSYESLVIHLSNIISVSIGYGSLGEAGSIDFSEIPSVFKLQLELSEISGIQSEITAVMEHSDLILTI